MDTFNLRIKVHVPNKGNLLIKIQSQTMMNIGDCFPKLVILFRESKNDK